MRNSIDFDAAWSTHRQPPRFARARRPVGLGGIIVGAIRAVGAIARRVLTHYRQRRDARMVYDALRELDDRTLHDLGFDRSEITSVAAEATGEAEPTRARCVRQRRPSDRG